MQRNTVILSGKELVFYYFNEVHDTHYWRKPISFAYHKINFFLEMDATVIINDTIYHPRKYDFLSFAPYTNHYGIVDRKQNIEYFEFLIPENFFECIDKDAKMNEILHHITARKSFSLPPAQRDIFTQKMYSLRDLLQCGTSNVFVVFSLLDILFDIHQYSNHPTQIPTKTLSKNLLAVTAYIENNFTTLRSVNELSDGLHLSRSYIAQLFKNEMGCTPYEYLTDVKIEHSIKLLRAGRNVTEACYESGFSSCSVYIQVFKKKLSMTPYQYKKMILQSP